MARLQLGQSKYSKWVFKHQRKLYRKMRGGNMAESKKYTLNKADLKSLVIGFIIVLAGSALTFVSENVGQIDWGVWTPFVVAFAALLVNLSRKYLQGK